MRFTFVCLDFGRQAKVNANSSTNSLKFRERLRNNQKVFYAKKTIQNWRQPEIC
ncbi:MAG: hypothetical protein LBP59_06035 [Planctomycetaceae bacterium]|nr:hypothetical protein [Planctomycetaceae bacterium]